MPRPSPSAPLSSALNLASDVTQTVGTIGVTVGSVAAAVEAVASAAEAFAPTPETQAAKERRRRAREIGRLARKLHRDLGRIDGEIDTQREVRAWARVVGWRAELAALGVEIGD